MAWMRNRKSPLRRYHQLNGPGGISPAVGPSAQPNFKFNDVPVTIVALGIKHACYVPKIRMHFRGTLTNPTLAPITIARKLFTPMLISSVQVQGTHIGTPVSSTHSLGGILDIDQYVRNGGRFNTVLPNGGASIVIAPGLTIPFEHFFDCFTGSNPSQHEGHHTSPLALFLKPGEIYLNCPPSFVSVDASLAGLTAAITVTAHAVIDPETEIRIAMPWQLTRHKANAGAGADSVQVVSFGANSTLVGVEGQAGIQGILWASSELVGDAQGAGKVDSITQFSADFLGLGQSNDPASQVNELLEAYQDGGPFADGSIAGAYPFFTGVDNEALVAASAMAAATVFPIMVPVPDFDASKLLDGSGQPAYNITGTFANNHYTYVWGCYPLSDPKQASLLEVIKASGMGMEMYGTNDLEFMTKLSKKNDPYEIATHSPRKFTYLPKKVIPKVKA